MTKMDPKDVAAIAELARLECDDATLQTFARQLEDILTYMDTLNQLDTSEVQPLYSPVRHETAFRGDEVRQEYSREELLSNAPEADGRYFIVPKVF
ncbi:Asp-tRNA(Asn)/Glu-tRNA(Gln) amidotransferase subunit GatC [Desulfovermiculus halophilus]|jgi:aspartyl-tRNA(Asn)/glutamyl-tRNA(Gln) amidotransferase subunit C|uniref:Asp-tRNA(Asn)/Glu-tRNA(Gln) amidotransferase subunit GatC n=1 Tax=Desulfovermiculus halophilus TaxID=339722 RepID=UPI000485C332|nr:Asp-tRNA(Asn)/Glu-tRNA(Gln) amidotransferase subunit GatC [Desulfovermiculus halophilus]